MSLREVSSSKPLLAKKGGAAPVKLAAVRAVPAEPLLRPIESDGDIPLESASADATAGLETSVGPEVSATGKRGAESAPAASLLPFDLLRKKYRPEASPDLAEDEPDVVPADFVAADLVAIDLAATLEPEPKQQAELALRVEPKPAAEAELRAPVEAKPVPELKIPRPLEPEADAHLDPAAPAPTPDPDWRVGAEAAALPKRASGGGWLLPVGALAAAFAALVVGWNMANPDVDLGFGDLRFGSTPEPVVAGETASDITAPTSVEPPPPIAESPAPAEPEASTAAVEPKTTAPTPLETSLPEPVLSPTAGSDVASESNTSGTPAEAEAVDLQPAETPSETQGAADQSAPAPVQAVPVQTAPVQTATTQQTAAPAPAAPAKPTVDVVRLEASGEAVIAGRAAPNSELIVLDNGEPIGTVQADAFGEWVFVPDVALPTGDHEFGLVVKTVQESVNLPAPSKPSLPPAPDLEPALTAPESASESAPVTPLDTAPDTAPGLAPDVEAGNTPDVAPAAGVDGTAVQKIPVPLRKPAPAEAGGAPADDQAGLQETPATKVADFVVQLASVKTRAGAEREWRKLKQRFPGILSDMVPALDEAKLADYGTVIRIRTGAFDSQRDAANLCAQLAAKRQACLVVKTSGGN